MNWLIYIGGYVVFHSLFNIQTKGGYITTMKCGKFNIKPIVSLMIWIWICWRFIR